MGAECECSLPSLWVAAGGPDTDSGCGGEGDQGGGYSAAYALDQNGVAGFDVAGGEEHAVGGEPGCGEAAGFFPGEVRVFGDDVGGGDGDVLGEGSGVFFRQEAAGGVEGFVAAPGF